MTQLVPFEAQLPAHISQLGDTLVSGDDLTSGAGGGFPVISIKGKAFHIVRGDTRELVTRADGDPASSIEVVILRGNPALSKTYYAQGFVEGSEDKPTCYSNNGVAPEADAAEPQSTKCAVCPHNQWGSKITDQGSKAKRCADVRRLSVAPIGALNDPMLLRVPAASLKPLADYGDMLKKRGVKYPAVTTKIGFDPAAAYPSLTFAPVSFITPEMARTVQEMIGSDVVSKMLGLNAATQKAPAEGDKPQPSGVVPAAIAAPKPATNTAPAPKVALAATKPEVVVKSKSEAKRVTAQGGSAVFSSAAPAAPTEQKSKLVEVQTGGLEADLSKALADAGFDDAA